MHGIGTSNAAAGPFSTQRRHRYLRDGALGTRFGANRRWMSNGHIRFSAFERICKLARPGVVFPKRVSADVADLELSLTGEIRDKIWKKTNGSALSIV